jgi:hypothetical protein
MHPINPKSTTTRQQVSYSESSPVRLTNGVPDKDDILVLTIVRYALSAGTPHGTATNPREEQKQVSNPN